MANTPNGIAMAPRTMAYAAALIALALIIIYLTIAIINESITITTLKGEVNGLLTKYKALELQYNSLLINYTSLIDSIYGRFIEVKPILYIYNGTRSILALYLNITNPTNESVSIGIISIKISPPISRELPWIPTTVVIPPRVTVMIPLMLAVLNKTTAYLTNYVMIDFSLMRGINAVGFMSAELSVTINSTLIPTQATYSAPIISITSMNKPMGYAVYMPVPQILTCPITTAVCGPSIILALENPLPTTLQIRGYSIYSYNGSTLTSCTLTKAIIVNSTSIAYLALPSISTTFKVYEPPPQINTYIIDTAKCTTNYWFPMNTTQLPYGYVTLNIDIGNITIPLLPKPTSIIIGPFH